MMAASTSLGSVVMATFFLTGDKSSTVYSTRRSFNEKSLFSAAPRGCPEDDRDLGRTAVL